MARKAPEQPPAEDTTMASFADLVTSLMAFFVLIVAISTIDQQKVEYVQESISEEVLQQEYEKPFVTLETKIQDAIENQNMQKDVFLKT